MNVDEQKRFVMMGGFLGAGKTTSVLRFARWLHKSRGYRVGIVMNDQSNSLVDTALAEQERFTVAEIGGGCFCCKSESLVEVMSTFSRELQPHVLIGEPVGSCTDLVSTVLGPLRQVYRTDYVIAPFSVVVDPFRAERICGIRSGCNGFSEEVNYIYRKQLEEAEILVINKADVFAPDRLAKLAQALGAQFPSAEVISVSARVGTGVTHWWKRLLGGKHKSREPMAMDYQTYTDGEARLGWLNAKLLVCKKDESQNATAGELLKILQSLADLVVGELKRTDIEVAHFKMALLAEGRGELAVIQFTGTDSKPTFTRSFEQPTARATLLVNLRAEAMPEVLSEILRSCIEQLESTFSFDEIEHQSFKPLPPKPTHRLAVPA